MVTQTELQFRASAGGRSQNGRLKAYLEGNANRWLPMPELARVITETGVGAAVHSRIADCRRKFGMVIEHKGGRNRASGVNESFYRYVPGPNEQIETSVAANPGGV